MIPKLGKTHKNLRSIANVPPCAKGLVYAVQQHSGSVPSLQNGISHDDRTNFTMKFKTRSNSLSSCFYEVKEIGGKKKINRLGFFAKVEDEETPYAWYNHEIPVVDIDTEEMYALEEEPRVILMDKKVLEMRLGALENATELHLIGVSERTPVGVYYSL